MSETLKQTKSVYSKYGDKIGISKRLVMLIENQEKFEELLFKVSMYMFFASAAYLFLKRFYLVEIARLFMYALVEWVIKGVINLVQTVFKFRFGMKQIYDIVREDCGEEEMQRHVLQYWR